MSSKVIVAVYVVAFAIYFALVWNTRDQAAFGGSAVPLAVASVAALVTAVILAVVFQGDRGSVVRSTIALAIPFVFLYAAIEDSLNRASQGEPQDVECRVTEVLKSNRSSTFTAHLRCAIPDEDAKDTTIQAHSSGIGGADGVLHATIRRGLLGTWLLDLSSVNENE